MERHVLPVSSRSRLRRKKERGSNDLAVVNSILDEGLLCHVGFADGDSTFVLPTTYARVGDHLFLHGAAGNRMLATLASGVPACIAVTLLDGLVLARSAFHHSMNYRSVVLFGTGRHLEDPAEKRTVLLATLEHMAPGRSADARPPSDAELRSTLVISFPIEEGSAKVRTGGPIEEPEDLGLPVWAGQLPFAVVAGVPVADDRVGTMGPPPSYVVDYSREQDTPDARPPPAEAGERGPARSK